MKIIHLLAILFYSNFSLALTMEDKDFIFENFGADVSNQNSRGYKANDECGEGSNFVHELYGEKLPEKCKGEFNPRKEKAEYCNCLKEGVTSNFLIQDILKSSTQDYKDKQNSVKKEYLKKFSSAYSQLTIGETVQQIILGVDREKPIVTCSPQQLSENITDAREKYLESYEEFLNKKLTDFKTKIDKEKCEKGDLSKRRTRICNQLIKEKDNIANALTPEAIKKKRDDVTAMVKKPNCFTDTIISDLKNSLKAQRAKYEELVKANPSDKSAQERLDEVSAHLSKIELAERPNKDRSTRSAQATPSFSWNPATSNSAESIRAPESGLQFEAFDAPVNAQDLSLESGKNGSPSKDQELTALNCKRLDEGLEDIYMNAASYDEYLKQVDLSGSEGPTAEACNGDPVCINFKLWNDEIGKDFKDRFTEKPYEQCVSFAEYKLMKSLPNDDFIKRLSKQKDPVSFLDPSQPKDQEQKLKFLRGNPILAKFVQSPTPELKNSLNDLLIKLSSSLSEAKTEPQKLKIYLDFLKDKNGLQSLASSNSKKLQDATVCADLARNYTAIQVADYLPPDGEDSNKNLSLALSKELIMCERESRPTDDSEILKTLQRDPIFTLGDPNEDLTAEKETDDYKKFLAETCQLNGESYPDFIQKNCKSKPIEACRQEFLSLSAFKNINDVFNEAGVNSGLGNVSMDDIFSGVSQANQDNEFMSWFESVVMPNINIDPLGLFGMDQYLENQRKEFSFLSNVQIPSRVASGTSSASSSSVSENPEVSLKEHSSNRESSINPGQVQPKFNFPAPNSNQAQNNSRSQSRTPASTAVNSVRDNTYVAGGNVRSGTNESWSASSQQPQHNTPGINSDQKTDLDKIAEDNKKLKDINTNMEKTEATASGATQAGTVSGAFAKGANPVVGGAQSVALPGPGPKSTALGPSPIKKGTFNDALNSIHEKSAMNVLGGVVDPKEFKGAQQSAKDLIVDDPRKFEKLGEDPVLLEAFIKEKMKGMAVGESKIITIINSSPNRPVPHMIFRIKAKEDGSFDIQSVPSEVPVRVATLKSLIDQLPKK